MKMNLKVRVQQNQRNAQPQNNPLIPQLTFFKLLQLLQPRLPRSPTHTNRPLESQIIQTLNPLLRQTRLQPLLELAIFGTLTIHECPQGLVVTVLEGDVDVAVLVFVVAEFFEPVFPGAVCFAEGPLRRMKMEEV